MNIKTNNFCDLVWAQDNLNSQRGSLFTRGPNSTYQCRRTKAILSFKSHVDVGQLTLHRSHLEGEKKNSHVSRLNR